MTRHLRRRHNLGRWCFILLLLGLTLTTASAFCGLTGIVHGARRKTAGRALLETPQRTIQPNVKSRFFTQLSVKNKNNSGKGDFLSYNDDCFGLIFLTSIVVAQDAVFAACFALLSALAAYSFSNGTADNVSKNFGISANKLQLQVPAAVAGLTLLVVAPVGRVLLQPDSIEFLPTMAPEATLLEFGVVAVSVIYALVQTRNEE